MGQVELVGRVVLEQLLQHCVVLVLQAVVRAALAVVEVLGLFMALVVLVEIVTTVAEGVLVEMAAKAHQQAVEVVVVRVLGIVAAVHHYQHQQAEVAALLQPVKMAVALQQ
jgi:hypothetical protein